MSSDIVKRLRERRCRLAAENNEQMAERRQQERAAGADRIEALEAEVAKVKASAKKFFADAGAITKNADQELEDMADALRVTLDAKNAAEARAERLRVAIVTFITYADQQPNRRIGSGAGGQTMEATMRASGRLVSDWHIGQLEEALNEPIEDDKQ